MLLAGCNADSQQQAPDDGEREPVGEAREAVSATCSGGVCTSATVSLLVKRAGSTAASVFDASINQGTPTSANGTTSQNMATGLLGGNQRQALIQFDLSAIPSGAGLAALHASGVTVSNGYLTLTEGPIAPGGAATINVHQVTSAWTEAGATWNAAPTYNATATTSFTNVYPFTSNVTLSSINIPSLVQGWANGTIANDGILLKTAATNLTTFITSEYPTASGAGTANVDLRGTLFAMVPGQLSTQGYAAVGSVTVDLQNKTASLTGGGSCGATTTANFGATPLQLVYQPDCPAGFTGTSCNVALAYCALVRSTTPSAGDGLYTFTVAGNPVDLYCHDMANAPTEYLPLAHTGPGQNFSTYAPDQTTTYTKVRFHPDTLTVDLADATFATNVGTDAQGYATIPYATAEDCIAEGSGAGTANVDLTGTLFAMVPGQLSTQGYAAVGSVTVDFQNKTANLTGGGSCGVTTTANFGATPLQLVYQPDAPPPAPVSSPADLPGLAMWVKADAGITFGSGASVASWADQSGNGNDLTMASASNQPTLVGGAQNGLPVVETSAAASQTLTVATTFGPAYSVFYVGRMLGSANQRLLTAVNDNWLLGWWSGAEDQAYAEGWLSPVGSPATTTAWRIYAMTGTGAVTNVYRNDALSFSSAGGVAAPDGLSLSCYGGAECSDGQVGEIVVYDHVLTATEIQQVFGYLDVRWNVY
jgi:hypothetical protein